jgi:hypothetical protein
MINVVFRPILLTIGLLLAIFLMHAIAYFAIDGFSVASDSVLEANGNFMSKIFGFIFVNFILTMLVIVLAHKAHEIIYETADNVMKWIGFGVSGLGTVKNEGQVGSMFQKGAGMAQGAASGMMGRLATPTSGDDKPGGGNKKDDDKGGEDEPEGGTETSPKSNSSKEA